MKTIRYTLILLGIALASCTEVLDVEPTASISSSTAINDKAGLERAVTGAYATLQSIGAYGRNQILVQDLAADNLEWTGTTLEYSQIAGNNIAADNAVIEGMWSAGYDGINRVNNILYRLPDIEGITAEEREAFRGDALFLRALFHFNLLQYFGGIPIKTTPTLDLSNVDQARNTLAEVYERVITDLTDAEASLGDTRSPGMASSYSASALLARVQLSAFHALGSNDHAVQAINAATRVIAEGGYSLATTYGDLFDGNTTEPVFEVVFDAQNSNRLAQYFFARSLTGRYEVGPSNALMQGFDPADLRSANTFTLSADNVPYGIKYKDIVAGTDRVMVLRLAEMYLIRAEARAYTNGDIGAIRDDIDILRTRAGLPATTASDHESLKLAIENERRWEFAFEGQRWSDLVRTGRAVTVLGIDPDFMLFPIPLSELLTNKLMTPNPGY